MKRALVALVLGTVMSGLAAAYASTVDHPANAYAPTAKVPTAR